MQAELAPGTLRIAGIFYGRGNGNYKFYLQTCVFLREEHRLRVFEDRVLRRILGPKRDEVTGGWRELHNEELRDLYSSPSIIRMIKSRRVRSAGHVARKCRMTASVV
jgi:hypothetical protein